MSEIITLIAVVAMLMGVLTIVVRIREKQEQQNPTKVIEN